MTAAPGYSVAGTLAEHAPHAAPGLVTPAAWRALRETCALFPAALTRAVYLECRLREGAGQVDLVLKVEEPGRAILAGENPAVRLPDALRAEPGWQRVAELCARWGREGSLLRRAVSHLWLEVDLPPGDAPRGVPRPSLFAALRPETAGARSAEPWAALLAEVAAALLPAGLDGATRSSVLEALGRRPRGVEVPYLGVMLPRPEAAVRIYLRGLAGDALPRYLRSVGWPGRPGELAAAHDLAGPDRPAAGMIHVDVAGEVLPRMGIEHTLARPPQLRGVLEEQAFLRRLVSRGACTEAKHAGLLAWPGYRCGTLPHELWQSVLARRVNCVKTVCGPAGPEAKGYLLAYHVPAPVRTHTSRR